MSFTRRTLTIGGVTKRELLVRLKEASVSLNDYARELFDDPGFHTMPGSSEVEVVAISLPELGLSEGGTFDQILEHAAAKGLKTCPLEVAPHLRLSYLDQPRGPYLTVASRELHPGTEQPNGFYLRHLDDGLWLRGYESGPENVYAPDFSDFVFLA